MTHVSVRLDEIVDAPENRELHDIAGLAKNIKENGLQVPPTLRQLGDAPGQYEIIAGHRRVAALRRNEETFVYADVRKDVTDDRAAVLQLIDNLQRQNLDPLDEARQMARIIGLGMSIKELATKAGRSQVVVRSRLRLLELPEEFHENLRAGALELGEAEIFAKADVAQDVKLEAFRLMKEEYGEDDAERAIEVAKDTIEGNRRAIELAEDYAVKQIPVWDTVNDDSEEPPEQFTGFLYVTEMEYQASNKDHHIYFGDKGKTKHAKQPCHAVVIDRSYRTVNVHPVCLDSARHETNGESQLKRILRAAKNKLSDEEKAQRKESKDAKVTRFQFLTDELKRKQHKSGVVDAVLSYGQSQWRNGEEAVKLAVQLLELDLVKTEYGHWDHAGVLQTYASDSSANQVRAWAAFLWAKAEEAYSPQQTVAYYNELVGLGYQLTPGDKKVLAQKEESVKRWAEQKAEIAAENAAAQAELDKETAAQEAEDDERETEGIHEPSTL